jgi:hypothetical protein
MLPQIVGGLLTVAGTETLTLYERRNAGAAAVASQK